LTYELFCSVHEDCLEWLLDVEDQLAATKGAADASTSDLPSARGHYQTVRAFLSGVEAQDSSVGEVNIADKTFSTFSNCG